MDEMFEVSLKGREQQASEMPYPIQPLRDDRHVAGNVWMQLSKGAFSFVGVMPISRVSLLSRHS